MRHLALAAFAIVVASSGAYAQPAPSTTHASPMPGVMTTTATPPRPTAPPPAATAPATPAKPTTTRTSASSSKVQLYKKEGEAQTACTGDTVVWGNSSTHVYHASGSPLYGKTKRGGYMCQKAADGGGYHAAKNGG